MENNLVIVRREWKSKTIVTEVRVNDEAISITLPLGEFVDLLATHAVSGLSVLSTRQQVLNVLNKSARDVVEQVKKTSSSAFTK
jgi:hypothetical protein